MNKLRLKICGMKEPENIRHISSLPVDYMGFIFYGKSPRCVDPENPEFVRSVKNLPESIKRVGVFVDDSSQRIIDLANKFHFDLIQLHGKETPDFCEAIRKEKVGIIKAIRIENDDPGSFEDFNSVCDFLLFEPKGKYPGGNNLTFDWTVLNSVSSQIPFFLSGGININNFHKALELPAHNLFGIDINSGFELYPGVKDMLLIKNLIYRMQNV